MTPLLSLPAIFRVVASLVAAERAYIGTGRAWDSAAWTEDTSLGPEGLALDSLELVAASEVVSRFFRLHETGDENRLLNEATLGGWSRIVAASLMTDRADGFTFATSGTTGLPKLCRQSMEALYGEAMFWSQQFAGCQRIIQSVASHHIYGFLFTVLLPEITGWPVLDVRMMYPGSVSETLRPSDLLVSFPDGLASMLRCASVLPTNLRVVSATASLPKATHDALLSCAMNEVVDIYGSSETAGIAARRNPETPFELLPRWRRAETDDKIIEIKSGAAFGLPDHVEWNGDRHVRPSQRIDGAVQVAGVNVFPQRVAEKLRAHPLIVDCMVSLDRKLAEPRLRAIVVPVTDVQPEIVRAACDEWCRRRFNAPERPISFEVVARLPAAIV